MNVRVQTTFRRLILGSAIVAATTISIPRPAQANTTSTALIAAGAAAIIGALLTDANNHPYYVQNNRRYYVTPAEANYYRSHRNVVQRTAWVQENQYPVQRNAGYRMPQQQAYYSNNQQRNNQQNGNQRGGSQRNGNQGNQGNGNQGH